MYVNPFYFELDAVTGFFQVQFCEKRNNYIFKEK